MSTSLEFDIVVVGAGIIGLTIARQFLMETDDLSVAIVDASAPCSRGATGAGQGCLWMVHKTPGSETWEFAMRSKQLWEMLALSIQDQGMDPMNILGWKRTGSLLVGKTEEEVCVLKERVKLLSDAGLKAEYLSASALHMKEPSLEIGKDGGAVFLPDDCQLDALRAVAFIEKGNRYFAAKDRYAEFYHDPVLRLIRSEKNGEVEAVQTSKNILYCKKAVVIAAGSWSGSLMQNLVREFDLHLELPVKPRKGHLLVIENYNLMQLNHGLMEVGYEDHQVVEPHFSSLASPVTTEEQTLSISMTATMDVTGNLVLGSSREFAGFNMEVEDSIIERIWVRAAEFFPSLRELSLADVTTSRKVKIGLRPYMPDGKPIIGPIPSLPKVVIATGHEGGGLLLINGMSMKLAFVNLRQLLMKQQNYIMERSPVSENRSPVKVHESRTTPENDDVLGNETDNNLMEEVEEEASVGHADKKIKLSSESDVKSCGDFEVLSEPRNVEKGNSSAPIEDESSVNNVGDGSYCAKPKSCFKVESVNRTEEGVDLGNENHDEVQPTIPSKRLCFIEAALKVINAKLDEMWACNCRLFDAITLCEKCLRPDSTGDFASMLKIESFVEACDAATNSVTPTTDSSAYQQLLAIISPQTSKRLMEATVRLQPREELNIICRKNNWAAPIYYLLPPTDVGIQYLVSVEGMDFVYSEFGEIETDIDKAKDSGAEKILAKLREMVAR